MKLKQASTWRDGGSLSCIIEIAPGVTVEIFLKIKCLGGSWGRLEIRACGWGHPVESIAKGSHAERVIVEIIEDVITGMMSQEKREQYLSAMACPKDMEEWEPYTLVRLAREIQRREP